MFLHVFALVSVFLCVCVCEYVCVCVCLYQAALSVLKNQGDREPLEGATLWICQSYQYGRPPHLYFELRYIKTLLKRP